MSFELMKTKLEGSSPNPQKNSLASSKGVTRVSTGSPEFLYRGYGLEAIAAHFSFAEATALLVHGDKLCRRDLEITEQRLNPQTQNPIRFLIAPLDSVPLQGWLESALPTIALPPKSVAEKGLILLGKLLGVVITLGANLQKKEPLAEGPLCRRLLQALSHRKFDVSDEQILEKILVLSAENGCDSATLAARVAVSGGACLHAAVQSAIAAYSSSQLGGAPERAIKMLLEVANPENAYDFVAMKLEAVENIPGFFVTDEPRENLKSRLFSELASRLAAQQHDHRFARLVNAISDGLKDQTKKHVSTSPDLWVAICFHLLGVPSDWVLPLLSCARVSGWTAHILEQKQDSAILLPELSYIGPRYQTS